MTRIAHLSDLHLNGSRSRREKFLLALRSAHSSGANRLLVTGDLTARGREAQFDEVGRALEESGWDASRTHVVFGNHDGVFARDRAKSTRLQPYCDSIGGLVGPDLVLTEIDTVFPKRAPLFAAMGRITTEDVSRIEALTAPKTRCVIAAMHHGPQGHPLEVFEGLVGRQRLLEALEGNENLHILCGHDHRALDSGRVRVAGSVAHHPDPLRVYDVVGPKLVTVYKSQIAGSWISGMLD